MMIHKNRLASIKKMAREAMPGPWVPQINFKGESSEQWTGLFESKDGAHWFTLNDCRKKDVKNARFIAACVNLVLDIIESGDCNVEVDDPIPFELVCQKCGGTGIVLGQSCEECTGFGILPRKGS